MLATRLFSVLILATALNTASIAADKPRLLVLTDIGADPDDQQSLVRLLLYANEFEIEGLMVSSSGTTGKREQHVTRPELVRELVEAYARVQPNLSKHAAGYPAADELLARIKVGNPERGLSAIGQSHDTEASRWIIATGDKVDARPLCIAIWGGQTDLAQALWRVKADRGSDGLRAFLARLRIYDVADQDGIAAWIQEQFPRLFYVQAGAPPGRDKREGAFRGMYLGGDESLVRREWMETNIRQNHGPLAALYPPRTWTAPNPHSAMKEGDTPSWFFFMPHGLSDAAHPEWGGFGGRFEPNANGVYRDAADHVGEVTDARATVWRWRPTFQADFQARLNWCVADAFEKANHAPVAVLNGDRSRDILRLSARSGETIKLSAAGSDDLDKNRLAYRWFIYPEAGTYRGQIAITTTDQPTTSLVAPTVPSPQTIHVILQSVDDGMPPLSAFRRAIVTIEP
jgi:Cellulose-binding Sde182, nucleoside hydrolase-like domain/Cellulose-binding protein Sde0182, C-terminal domain